MHLSSVCDIILTDSRRNKISLVNEELVSYRAPHSDSERIYKEITTLKIIGDTPGTADSADGVNCFGSTDSMVMEIELEASHNLAMAKTHYIFNNNTGLNVKVLNNYFNNQLVETFNKLVDPNRGKINGQISSRFFPYDSFLKILFCTSLDETIVHELVAKVQVLDRNERKTSQSASNWDYLKDVMIDILIISNKWSEDRRISYEYTPSSVEGHYKNAMAVNAAAATLSETQKAYKGNIMAFETIFSILIRGNNNIDSTNVNKVVDRIVWLFDESPAAITTEIIARVLLKQKMYESKSTIRTDKQKGVVSVSTLLSSQKIKDAIERREKSSSLLILCMVDNIISYNSNSKNNISNGLMCLNHGEIGRVFLFKLKNFFHT